MLPKKRVAARMAQRSAVICPICENEIIDASEKCVGADSIKCEGLCKAWLHKKCASICLNQPLKQLS